MMNQDPHVTACVMFGRGRFQAGLIVEPKPEYQFDPSDEAKLAEFRNKIWCVLVGLHSVHDAKSLPFPQADGREDERVRTSALAVV